MQGKTIHYQISHDNWKTYFSRFANKNRYMTYILLILAAFVIVYSLCLDRINKGGGDEFMYLLFVAFAAAFAFFFIKFLRGSMPGPQTARYEKQLIQQYGTTELHYALSFENKRLVYSAQEDKSRLTIPYASIRLIMEGRGLVCIQSEPDGKPTNIVCPTDALEGGVQPLIDFLKSKNPNCKVKHL